jgi:phosphoglycolate phosphatase
VTTVILWDIDQTLLRTGGAGSAAMEKAFLEIYGIADAFARVEFSGRTDFAIFFDALDYNGLDKSDYAGQLASFRGVYVQHLARMLPEREGEVLPGVLEVIAEMEQRQAAQGVATGNFEAGARLKLGHFGLNHRLRVGAYGDTTADRGVVVAEAAAAVKLALGVNGASAVHVIGDTPFDVEAARVNGYRSLAVATGRFSTDELEAAGADAVFKDLSDVTPVVRTLAESG